MHSVEHSAQEDTLLVLFNTAISNMVGNQTCIPFLSKEADCMFQILFRNNFAISRNIAGLFQSFQSLSTVLDPVAHPSLFQSLLVIIIKVTLKQIPAASY